MFKSFQTNKGILRTLIWFALFALIFLGLIRLAFGEEPGQKQTPPPLTVNELKKLNPKLGEYQIRGFVVYTYTCPRCPEDVQCKPCMGNNIVISDNSKLLENYSGLSDKTVIVFVPDASKFILGKKLSLNIRIKQVSNVNQGLSELELVSVIP